MTKMKHILKRCMAFMVALLLVLGVIASIKPTEAEAKRKYPRPGKPKVSIKAGDSQYDVVMTIGKTSKAEGYNIYVKKPGSKSYVLLKTLEQDGTKKRTINIVDFDKVGTYYFKVRSYYKTDGVTVSSLYSKVKKYKVTDAMLEYLKGLTSSEYPLEFKDKNTVYFGHYPHSVPESSMIKTKTYDYYEDYMHDRDAWAGTKTTSDPDGSWDRIQWIILDEREDSYLLMSKDVLDVVQMAGKRALCYYSTIEDDEIYDLYKYEDEDVEDGAILTWEDTKLRKWLNNEFLEYAFTPEERNYLYQMQVDACGKEEGTCNDYVTIPSSDNLELYMKPKKTGEYAFDLIAKGTSFATYSQYSEEVGPYRNISYCDDTNGYRVLRRIYHSGGSASKVGYNWSGSKLDRETYESLGCPEELLGKNTVSYWLRDVDLSKHDELVNKGDYFSQYCARYGIYKIVTFDGRYRSLYQHNLLLSDDPIAKEGNISLFYDAYWGTGMSGIRPIILVAKDKVDAVIANSGRGGVIGSTGKKYGGNKNGTDNDGKDKDYPPEEYTVEFMAQGGKGRMDPVKVTEGPYTIPECAYTKENHIFVGWELGGVELLNPGDTINVNSNIVLFAKWEKKKIEYAGATYVYFGYYEQDGNTANGKEPIEWIVLEDKGDTLVLMSQDIIYANIFYEDFQIGDEITWDKSYIRKLLNSEFLNDAFTSDEQQSIISRKWETENCPNEKNPRSGGKTVTDKVSILSREEVLKYFTGDGVYDAGDCIYSYRLLAKSSDAVANSPSAKTKHEMSAFPGYDKSAYKSYGYPDEVLNDSFGSWWLRTPGSSKNGMLYVSCRGQLNNIGTGADTKNYSANGVRPVIEVSAKAVSNAKNVNRMDTVSDTKDSGKKDSDTKDTSTKDTSTKDSGSKDNNTKDTDKKDTGSKDNSSKNTGTKTGSVSFGHYEQDGNKKNGKEAIEWIILEDKGDTLVLMSKDILDHKTLEDYTDGQTNYTWANSSIRKWLNNDFLKAAFTDSEQASIKKRTWSADSSPESTKGSAFGKDVKDKVSILSYEEVLKYFKGDDMKFVKTQVYCPRLVSAPSAAIAASDSNKNGLATFAISLVGKKQYQELGYSDDIINSYYSEWWLRTSNYKGNRLLSVSSHGNIYEYGTPYKDEFYKDKGIRPVIEVSASAVS